MSYDEPYDRDEIAEAVRIPPHYRIEVRIFDGDVEVGRSSALFMPDRAEPDVTGYRIGALHLYAEPQGHTVQLGFEGELTRFVVDG